MRLGDLKTSIRGNVVIARLSGEIDLSNSGELRTAITDATPNEVRGVVLDLSGVDYIDSAGLRFLLRVRERLAGARDKLILLVGMESKVERTLQLVGFDRLFRLVRRPLKGWRNRRRGGGAPD